MAGPYHQRMEILRATLQAPSSNRRALERFYTTTLGLGPTVDDAHRIGHTALLFSPHSGDPFYHFAILLPGDRFDPALTWSRERVELLPAGDGRSPVHRFENWDADAVYFHDPAGNIVELIAHHGKGENGRHGEFSPVEFLGLSELGLVGDPAEIAADLEQLELAVFDGTVTGPDSLAFIGEPTGTLILSPVNRGWLPSGRAAEHHPVEVTVSGTPRGAVSSGGHVVRRRGR